jgi:hypothetical protein
MGTILIYGNLVITRIRCTIYSTPRNGESYRHDEVFCQTSGNKGLRAVGRPKVFIMFRLRVGVGHGIIRT